MYKKYIHSFWHWYEQYYLINIGISAGLFLLQLIHLYWLTTDVVTSRLLGQSFFEPMGVWKLVIVLVDYLEIPTIVSVSLVYINELRQRTSVRSWLLLLLLNSQWIHIFWVTDEVVEEILTGVGATVLPVWAAWIAILIDYLELPVIADTVRRFIAAARANHVQEFLKKEFVE